MKENRYSMLAPVYCCGALLFFAAVLAIPPARQIFETVTTSHPYAMGFVKFSLLALCGELLAKRIAAKTWAVPSAVIARFMIWGVIGVWITFMMKINSAGVGALMQAGLLPGKDNAFLRAFFTSATMNLTFGPTFMAVHKCSDRWLDLKSAGQDASLRDVVQGIDWCGFVRFTLLRTVPFFWIPAHTVTFLLPETYQVMLAAMLSIALGIFLSIKNK